MYIYCYYYTFISTSSTKGCIGIKQMRKKKRLIWCFRQHCWLGEPLKVGLIRHLLRLIIIISIFYIFIVQYLLDLMLCFSLSFSFLHNNSRHFKLLNIMKKRKKNIQQTTFSIYYYYSFFSLSSHSIYPHHCRASQWTWHFSGKSHCQMCNKYQLILWWVGRKYRY